MVDTKTSLRMQLLVRDAGRAVYACHNKTTGGFVLLPFEDAGSPQFDAFVKDANNHGFAMVAVIALMKHATPDGLPLIECELMPGVSEEIAQEAKQFFRAKLIREGILKPGDSTIN